MTLNEIKETIEQGGRVCWKHEGYPVIKNASNRLIIVSLLNGGHWPLAKKDGLTLNEQQEDFYIP